MARIFVASLHSGSEARSEHLKNINLITRDPPVKLNVQVGKTLKPNT